MLEMLRDLVAHKGHANAAVLSAIRENGAASADPELNELLHHILVANRFWLLTILGLPFVLEDESRPSPSFDSLIQRYGHTQEQESVWLEAAGEAALARVVENPLIPGASCSVSQALMQVSAHTRSSRAVCEAAATSGRRATADRLHPVVDESTNCRVGRGSDSRS